MVLTTTHRSYQARSRAVALAGILALLPAVGWARGPSPYLPLDLSPALERKIERVLMLGGKPVMRRPIAAAVVLDALPAACERDSALCEEVRDYLERYMDRRSVTHASAQGAITGGDSNATLPNRHGESVDSAWRAAVRGHFQPNDYVILNVGGIAHGDDVTATGSFLSLGFDFAQLDIGYRDHWLSPLTDSSSLISTQAPTMPSITLSNYDPIGPLGLNYQIFLARASRQDNIRFRDSTTSGYPRIAGAQLGIEPLPGYALAVNRITQYGGGARNQGGLSQFIDALVESQNPVTDATGETEEFGNQVASITSSLLVDRAVPFGIHLEYAGEDNAYAAGYRLGATNLSIGVDLPQLWNVFDATFEISEWQNSWYVHHLYREGLINHGNVLGHWFGDQRASPGRAIGGRSEMLAVGWRRTQSQYVRAIYRTMKLDSRWARDGGVPDYETFHTLGLSLATDWRGFPIELELSGGQDIFGDSFARLSGSIDFAGRAFRSGALHYDAANGDTELFVDIGANRAEVLKILAVGVPNPPETQSNGLHIGFGARRVSTYGDIGMRFEIDEVDGEQLLSFRAFDYQYRVTRRLAVGAFAGVARYDYGLATNGYVWGAGVQFRDVLPKWDIGFDVRHYEKLNRDKSLPTDPVPSPEQHPRLYIDIDAMNLYISRRW